MTNLSFFGNDKQMKCNYVTIQLPENLSWFQGRVRLYHLSGQHKKPSLAEQRNFAQACLEQMIYQYGPNGLTNFNHDHLSLKSAPQTLVSISHAGTTGGACISPREKHLSIGMDIEDQNRNIPQKTKKFFMNEYDDQEYDENLLDLWVKKEAAFKAISPLKKEIKTLNDLFIRGNKFYDRKSLQQAGPVDSCKITLQEQSILMAVAAMK